MSLAEEVLAGSRLALARLLTLVENDTPQGRAERDFLFPHTGRAHLIGVTGSPGTGKSSLVNQIARLLRRPEQGEPKRVAIVAVDPSSPFTGGAVLGDRVRMRDLAGDPGVFIRSMASRGTLGGLARTTAALVQVLDAAGFEAILIETVGAGQSEVDVARLAHTTLVVEAPGLGDDIQAIKAGILEIADILVVNKADRPGVENTERALRSMLEFSHPADRHHPGDAMPEAAESLPDLYWKPPVLRTVAVESKGIAEVVQALMDHKDYLQRSGEWQRREEARLQNELEALLQNALMASWRAQIADQTYAAALRSLAERQLSPNEAVSRLIAISQERMAADEQQKALLRRWSPTDVYE